MSWGPWERPRDGERGTREETDVLMPSLAKKATPGEGESSGVCAEGGPAVPPVERLLWRTEDIVVATNLPRRTIERLRSRGEFPKPDKVCGRICLWRPETIKAWSEGRA